METAFGQTAPMLQKGFHQRDGEVHAVDGVFSSKQLCASFFILQLGRVPTRHLSGEGVGCVTLT